MKTVLSIRDLMFMLGVSRTTLWTMRKSTDFPLPAFGTKYLRSDIETWLQKRNVQFCSKHKREPFECINHSDFQE